MAPPRKKNPTFPKGGFVQIPVTVTDPSTGNTRTYTDYRPASGKDYNYDILTDDVLNSGNLKVLTDFQEKHEKELDDPKNEAAKEYLDARIQTAKRFQDRERKAKLDAFNKKTPPKLEVDNVDGIVGFSNLKYPDYQTSSNGCWSISYSTLLRSRGVDISQEEIRRWRPDYPEDIDPAKKATPARKLAMNSDTGNDIFTNADLLGKVLPNTALNQLRIEPFETEPLLLNGKPLEKNQIEIVKAEYKAQVKMNLQKTIMEAIQTHRSPVAATWDGHFVTITGISPDGKTLRYEESLGAEKKEKRTRTMSIDELVDQGLEEHDHGKEHYERGDGLQLNWLSDLPVAEYGSDAPQPSLDSTGNNFVSVEEDGSVSIDVPQMAEGFSRAGNPSDGQIHGASVEQLMNLDQTNLTEKLGGELKGWGFGDGVMFGAKSTYYPDRVMRPGDPDLQKSALEGLDEDIENVREGLSYIKQGKVDENAEWLENAMSATKTLSKAVKGKEKSIDGTDEKIAKLIDHLAEKPNGSKKTNFETYLYFMHEDTRRRFVEGLSALNQTLGLGKDKKIEQFEDLHIDMEMDYKGQHRRAALEYNAKREFNDQITASWNLAKENMTGTVFQTDERELMNDALARIIASYALYANNVEEDRKPPYPTEEEIQEKIPEIKQRPAFEEITFGAQGWKYDPYYGPLNFVQDYAKIEQRLHQENIETGRYAISEERLPVVQVAASQIAEKLDATKTGSYDGYGIISRDENSGKFEEAKSAIRKFSQKQDPSAKNVKTAVSTVLRYLDGKEKVRKRPFGRERWNDCMTFLSQTMPRDKFENYCKQVNEKRHVEAGHADFVGPETFYMEGTSISDVETETKARIKCGEATTRDYARLLACDRIRDDYDGFGDDPMCSTPEEKRRLCTATEEVISDTRFADFIGNMSMKERLNMIQGKSEDMRTAWATYKEANPIQTGQELMKDPEVAEVPEEDLLFPKGVIAPKS